VAEADNDCRPPGVRSTASEPKTNRFFAASVILHSSPHPSSLALAALPGDACRHSSSAHSARMATVQPGRIGAGFRASEKNAVQQAFTWRRFAPAAREPGWSNWIIWLAPEPFPKAIMGDERFAHSATLGSTRSLS
jgi:hypothetical protein